MNKISEISEWIKSEYNELNKSNFSVAIDVIVVRQKNGQLNSTPFYVRFGKRSVLKPKNVQAYIKVNDKVKSLEMRLNENGEAFFIGESSDDTIGSKDDENNSKSYKEKIISKLAKHSATCPVIRNVTTLSNLIEPLVTDLVSTSDKCEISKNPDSDTSDTSKSSSENPNFYINDTDDIQPKIDEQVIYSNRNLTHEQLVELDLEKGMNEIKYCVLTSKGEEKCVTGYIFLWNHYEKIVVSDIDGTITRSAFRGQILTIIGHDWYHDHISELLMAIAENGYKIIYLSARPFFQCDITRNVLKSVKQDEKSLPWGPLIVNPVGFLDAFQCEIIDKTPDEFKIKVLKDLKRFFPENPFYAGFGDKITDVNTYSSIGVHSSFIFIVNELGHVNFDPTKQQDQLNYKKLAENIEKLFPVTFI